MADGKRFFLIYRDVASASSVVDKTLFHSPLQARKTRRNKTAMSLGQAGTLVAYQPPYRSG